VPQPILTKLNTDLNRLLAGPLKQRLEDQAITVTPTTPEGFAAHVRSEIAKWTKVVRQARLEAE
jgi:tripartite-type tricarboxylate transporter receptor subunit TctC